MRANKGLKLLSVWSSNKESSTRDLIEKEKKSNLSGSFSVGWAKAGIAIVRDPDDWGMVGTLDPSALHIPKGFGLGPLTAEI